MLAETPVRTRGSDEIPESTQHRSLSIAGFAPEISFWIARANLSAAASHVMSAQMQTGGALGIPFFNVFERRLSFLTTRAHHCCVGSH
jgi:hypothetical protein